MKVCELTDELVPAFKDYFSGYSGEQDESFPPLFDHKARTDEPSFLLVDDNGKILGAAALMLHKEYAGAKTGRFRLFHCIRKEASYYKLLLDEILKYTAGLKDIYCFVEDFRAETRDVWEKLGFKIKRYSWVLKRSTDSYSRPEFRDGFELRTFREGNDEQAWCDIINESFANLHGHTHLYPAKMKEWKKEPSYIQNGMKMLWHNEKPVGTIALAKEKESGEDIIFIEAVGVLNSYQGKGLGKNLIRAGIEFGKNYGVKHVMLSVNAENERAADLYLKEGFNKEALIICYSLEINN
jgi:mycothiol synthase